MKFHINIRPAVLCASFQYLLFVSTNCLAQSPPKKAKDKGQYEYSDYDYGDGYEYKGRHKNAAAAAQSYDYGSVVETKPSFIMCYSCMYTVQQQHVMGMANCNEPFIERDIAKVECTGSCGKMYTKLDDRTEGGDYMVNRQCLPNCKESTSPRGYVKCCSKSLCNGASSSQSLLRSRHHVLLLTHSFLSVVMAMSYFNC